jgi:hypothetical protein
MLKCEILIQLFVLSFMLIYCVCGDTIQAEVVVCLLITYLYMPL